MTDDENSEGQRLFDERMLELMTVVIDEEKVKKALRGFLKHEVAGKLSGPEAIAAAAILLASVVKTCPSYDLGLKLFLQQLTKELPDLTTFLHVQNVDRATNS